MLSSAPVLAYYNTFKPTVVSMDTNSSGLGASLLQDDNGKLHPVAFSLGILRLRGGTQIEKECLSGI